MKKYLLPALILLTFLLSSIALAHSTNEMDVIEKLFVSENVEGTLVVASASGDMQRTFNSKRSKTRFSPASTYKILNTLIGLKYGVISSDDHLFQWDGVEHGVPAWNKNHSLASAFRVSCVWCYRIVAKKVGLSKYSKELKATSFGNQSVSYPVDLHWLNGVLKISANEQVDFLKSLVNNTLPYALRHMKILKKIMLVEKKSNYALYAKSGWTGPELGVGWYVGYVETASDTFIFAMNMTMVDVKQAPLRKKMVIQSLQTLKLI